VIALGACAREQVVPGECRAVYGADVCAWDRMAGDELVAFGITVPMQAVDSAPADAPMLWPPVAAATIPLSQTAKSAAGFDNVTIFWEAHGHPPAPYLVPHFDFHFNTVTSADLGAIDCADTTKPAQLPEAYELPDIEIPGLGMLVGVCVPQMGMHALASSELRAGTPFEKTMIVGYYGGEPIFLEPMITRGALLGRHSFPVAIPRVPAGQPDVRYPAQFMAEYDSTAQAYRFVFSNLGVRTAP
jgi:hypothetical protein